MPTPEELAVLDDEQGNVRVALDWALGAEGDADVAVRIAAAAGSWWDMTGRWTEGRTQLGRVLAVAGAGSPALRAQLLF